MEITERYFSTPNILLELNNVLDNTKEVTRKFYFLRMFWKFEIENKLGLTYVSLIVHDPPVNFPKFTFSVTSGWLNHNDFSLFEKIVSKVNTEDLITEKNCEALIWANDLKPYLSMFPDNTPTFLCTIRLHNEFDNIPELFEDRIPLVTSTSLGSLTGNLKSLLDSSAMTDVVLKCATKSIPAHKCILSCRSPVFKTMLQDDSQGTVKIEDVEPRVFQKIIDYVYTGNIDMSYECMESVCDLLKAADKFCLTSLKERCYDFLVDALEPSNACKVLLMTHLKGYSELKDYVLLFIASKRDFLLSEDWQKFSKEHETLALDVLSHYVEISKLKSN